MNIKPQTGKRSYAKGGVVKGYAAGGTVWPDASSPYDKSLPISGGSANLPGGTQQMGGPGVYDPEHPERGAQGWSTFYQPAESTIAPAVPPLRTESFSSSGPDTMFHKRRR